MEHLHRALPATKRGAHATNADALAGRVVACAQAGDIIAVKGSHGSKMSVVVDALIASSATAAKTAQHA
jgi:UDP-N-acetylmuramoyl-tripeptide--D-alanyl-D-alanine ligase